MTINLKSAARALGGDVAGRRRIRCPGPGHSRADRSLAVSFTDDGFLVHSFAGDDFRECRDHVKAALGLTDDRPTAPQRAPVDVSLSADERHRIDLAARLWAEAVPLSGTLAEAYLRSRWLAYDGYALRYHAGNRMMVALMTDAITGEPRGVHRTFLDADGKKVDRKMLGPSKGAVVRLSADEDLALGLGIAEGIETALATSFQPVWACLSAGTMRVFPVLSGIETLTIFADNDESGTGLDGAWSCAERWHAGGREVTVRMPKETGVDYADMREAA